MAAPWEKYQAPAAAGAKPWEKYKGGAAKPEAPNPLPKADFSNVTDEPDPRTAEEIRGLSSRSFARGLGGVADLAVEGARAAQKYSPVTALPNFVAEQLGFGMPEAPSVRGLADKLADKQGLPTPRNATERVASGVGEALTGTAATLGAGGLAGPGATLLRARPVVQALSSAGAAGAGETAREAGLPPWMQVAASLGGGAAAGGVTVPGRLASRTAGTPAMRDIVEKAASQGIPVRPAANNGGATGLLRGLPLTGSGKRYEQDVAKANKALVKIVDADADVSKTPVVTPEFYAAKKAKDKQVLNDLMARNELKVDQPLMQRMAAVEAEAADAGEDVMKAIRANIDRLHAQSVVGKNGVVVPGKAYMELDKRLSKIPKASLAKPYADELQAVIRDAMDKSISPKDSARWARWRQEYGDRKTIKKLVGKGQGKPIDPQELMQEVNVKAYNGSERMASGTRGPLGDLTMVGQNIVKPQTIKGILPIGALAAGGAHVVMPTTVPAIALAAGASNIAGRIADAPFLTRMMKSLRKQHGAAVATGTTTGTASQRKKKKDKK